MKRPYVILSHIERFKRPDFRPLYGNRGGAAGRRRLRKPRAELESDAWLYGTATTKSLPAFKSRTLWKGRKLQGPVRRLRRIL